MINYLIKISLIFIFLFEIINGGTTGKIKGIITDTENNEPIIGANVFIDGTSRGSVSDKTGQYFIINVPPGKYTVRVSYIGYTPFRLMNVLVYSDRTTTKNFRLKVQVLEGDEITVEAERPRIEKDRTSSASFTSADEIELMPVQEVEDIIELQAGVVKDSDGRLHLRGGRHGEISYLIDGITVSDQFRGGSSVDVQNNWIKELQVISGSFNAEYGQAQSGVINIITKDGSQKLGGSFSFASGGYLSNHSDIFYNIDDVNMKEVDLNADFHGPLPLLKNGSYLFSIRDFHSEGWLYGQKRTNFDDTVPIQQFMQEAQQNLTDEERLIGIKIPDSLQTGDGSFVPLKNKAKQSYFGKLSFYPFNKIKVSYSLIYNNEVGKSYSNYRRYSPAGVANALDLNQNHIINLNHMLSNNMFYTISYSNYTKNTKKHLFKDPLDPRYQGKPFSTNGYAYGGTDNSRYDITNELMTLKMDVTNQVNHYNQVKIGAEYKQHTLRYYSLSTVADGPVTATPTLRIPKENTSLHNQYEQRPFEASIYLQDKIEFDELILNAGLRYDYWDPNGLIPVNPRASTKPNDGIRLDTDFKSSTTHIQLSPRFGMAYNLPEKGVVHVSYGHFFQIPRLSYLYANSEFEVELGGLQTVMGNADLKPEKTVTFELGLQMVLNANITSNIAVYNKTTRNLLGQEIISTTDEKVYARYINRDYGNVRGITASLDKNFSGLLTWGIDYTYQVAKGNASDPNAVFVDFQSTPPKESEKQVVPLDWDQRHTFNATVFLGSPSKWNVGIVGRLSSGQPYTPTNPGSQLTTQFENSAQKPQTFVFDLNMYKVLTLGKTKFRLFTKIFNVFDRLNQVSVYSSTGYSENPYRSLAEREILSQSPNLTLHEINLRPNYYGKPRKILIGIKFNL